MLCAVRQENCFFRLDKNSFTIPTWKTSVGKFSNFQCLCKICMCWVNVVASGNVRVNCKVVGAAKAHKARRKAPQCGVFCWLSSGRNYMQHFFFFCWHFSMNGRESTSFVAPHFPFTFPRGKWERLKNCCQSSTLSPPQPQQTANENIFSHFVVDVVVFSSPHFIPRSNPLSTFKMKRCNINSLYTFFFLLLVLIFYV